jgi:putative colanic acid biosynthesis acetyltransferase WcaF
MIDTPPVSIPAPASTALPLPLDPYLGPSTTLLNRAGRFGWSIAYLLLFRPTPRPLHRWRALLLRLFGATLGPNCRIYAGARIWAPWNLHCEDAVAIADGAVIYNAAPIRLASHSIVSQDAYLCGATHDYDDPGFPMIGRPITLGRYAWICARAVVCAGVTVGDGAVLGLCSVATRDLQPWTVYAGSPARAIKTRVKHPSA